MASRWDAPSTPALWLRTRREIAADNEALRWSLRKATQDAEWYQKERTSLAVAVAALTQEQAALQAKCDQLAAHNVELAAVNERIAAQRDRALVELESLRAVRKEQES